MWVGIGWNGLTPWGFGVTLDAKQVVEPQQWKAGEYYEAREHCGTGSVRYNTYEHRKVAMPE